MNLMWLNAAVLGGDTPWIGGGSALRLTGEMYSTFIPCSAKCTAHCKNDVNEIITQPKTFSWAVTLYSQFRGTQEDCAKGKFTYH